MNNFEQGYSCPEFIDTHERLNEVSLGNLGKLKAGTTYDEFMEQASEVAAAQGVDNPRLLLAMKYNADKVAAQLAIVSDEETVEKAREYFSTGIVSTVADIQWDGYVNEIHSMVVEPDVHVVDGDKFNTST